MSCKHGHEQRRLAACDPVQERRGFIDHALTFAFVIGGLALLNLATSPHYLWFIWPLLGWGIGLAKHGLATLSAGNGDAGGSIAPVEPTPLSSADSGREWPDLES